MLKLEDGFFPSAASSSPLILSCVALLSFSAQMLLAGCISLRSRAAGVLTDGCGRSLVLSDCQELERWCAVQIHGVHESFSCTGSGLLCPGFGILNDAVDDGPLGVTFDRL